MVKKVQLGMKLRHPSGYTAEVSHVREAIGGKGAQKCRLLYDFSEWILANTEWYPVDLLFDFGWEKI